MFGKINNIYKFKHNNGILPYHNKDDALLEYKYTLNVENSCERNYCTEKLYDAILSECLCFYAGCPNVQLDSRCFMRLPIALTVSSASDVPCLEDIHRCSDFIITTINNREWEKRISFIRREKMKIISWFSFFPRLEGLLYLKDLRVVYLNLERRPDRNSHMIKQLEQHGVSNYERFPAVDCLSLNGITSTGEVPATRSVAITATFGGVPATDKSVDINAQAIQSFKQFTGRSIKKGEMGLWMTTLKVWGDTHIDTLILEDDVELCDDFMDNLELCYHKLKIEHPDFDILYLGFNKDENVLAHYQLTLSQILNDDNNEFIRPLSYYTNKLIHHTNNGIHGEGAYGYIISPKCAKQMKEYIEHSGTFMPVDSMLLFVAGRANLKVFCCIKELVRTTQYGANNKDTDIQTSDIL